ncbi:MAG: DNA repair protein RecN [Rhabdochlamydiaceae bacterium]
MITHLRIKNLVLVDYCELDLKSGLTIISGETGSGKTVFTQAIALCLGAKADPLLIRKGADKAFVEMIIDKDECFTDYGKQIGLDINREDPLILRRELVKEGKSRCFINSQQVTTAVLQKLGLSLVDFVGQHDNRYLFSVEYHRDILDLYADLSPLLIAFEKDWSEHKALVQERQKLWEIKKDKETQKDFIEYQLSEIKKVQLTSEEESAMFEKYKRLASFQEIQERLSYLQQALEHILDESFPNFKYKIDQLARLDENLEPLSTTFQEWQMKGIEIQHFLSSYINDVDYDSQYFSDLDLQLSYINKIKRKYGPSLEDVHRHAKELEDKLKNFEQVDEELEQIEKDLEALSSLIKEKAIEISDKRQVMAIELSKAIENQLKLLHLPFAECEIRLSSIPMNIHGTDMVEFYLKTNKGDSFLKIKECSSGGELARLLLAIKIVMAKKNKTQTLVFDEIDASIGGETATAVGNKLHELGQFCQVFCITHFPQVAQKGDHHIRIYKEEDGDRMIGNIENLSLEKRKEELRRMQG